MKNLTTNLRKLFNQTAILKHFVAMILSSKNQHFAILKYSNLFVLVLFLSTKSYAQYTISGKILDAESNKPLAGANVVLVNAVRGTQSNAQGFFTLKNVKKGTYTLKVSYVGYEKNIQVIDLQKDVTFDFKLNKSTFAADEVVVNGTRANAKSAIAFTDVSKEDIQKQNLGQDIPQLLNFTPSLVSTSDAGAGVGYTGVRIRGTDATRINVTINGIPVNDAESQGTFWVNTPDLASSVSSIQVQRGVGTSTNGAGAFGASINISTNEFRKQAYAEINSAYGSFNTLKNTILVGSGLVNDKFTFDARLSKVTSDGYVDRASADLKSFYLSGAYFGKKSFVRLNVFSGKEKTYQAWEGVSEATLPINRTFNLYTYPNQTDNYQQDHYQLLSSHTLSNAWTFNLNFHYTYGRGYYEQFKEQDKFSKYGLPNVILGTDTVKKTDLVRRKWLDNDFYGTTFSFDYQGSKKLKANIGGGLNQYEGRHYGEIIWAQYASTSKLGDRYYNGTAQKTDFNIYGKVFCQLSKKVNAFADLQVRTVNYEIKGTDDNLLNIGQKVDYQFFNPKFGVSYQIASNASAYASYSVGNKEPNRSDFVDNVGATPKSEKLNDFEAGYKVQKGKAAFALNGYFMNYNNQLVLTGKLNDVGSPIRVNVPESYRLGLEVEAGIQVNKTLKINANATLSENKIKNFTESIYNYDNETQVALPTLSKTDIAFSPNVIVGSQILFTPAKGLELGLLSKYVGKQYLDNTANENRKLDAYFTNDFRAIYTIKGKTLREVNFTFLVNNLFNTLYESNGYTYSYISEGTVYTENFYYPQAGTNVMAGISLKF
ncbi:iron complex outermembrane receptor protein [Arcicella rosea]|uniref:Iron complex outermembrane receptor protein n=2 Tax=Arcicella rosea TaxID=502909 RepID=A0A841EQH3_9BACT|nr:TonB-dependent receptor [Arcicella rosea]MBB6001681.1 iron complex outermembrane receptor protein [Arcicella rosea]